jgi:hypothetical protein
MEIKNEEQFKEIKDSLKKTDFLSEKFEKF